MIFHTQNSLFHLLYCKIDIQFTWTHRTSLSFNTSSCFVNIQKILPNYLNSQSQCFPVSSQCSTRPPCFSHLSVQPNSS
jgi:hypothetical protein